MRLGWWVGLLAVACVSGDRTGDNVLVVFLDDMGPDAVGIYGEVDNPPHTPTLDRLASTGMRFTHAYTPPICAPSRAALLTGQYGRRTGFGNNVRFHTNEWALDPASYSLADLVKDSPLGPYQTGVFGKWHLANGLTPDLPFHAQALGFDHYAHTFGNLIAAWQNEPEHDHDHFHWEWVVDGEVEHTDGYNLTATIDRTLATIDAMPEPWMVYLPLHSAHDPWHVPPQALQGAAAPSDVDRHIQFRGMVEAADTELDRLLTALGPDVLARTHVLVMGDNGTMRPSIAPDWDVQGYKASMADGGIRVPLIVNSPTVAEPGAVHDAFVHVVDVFATVADWVGLDPTDLQVDGAHHPVDGQSLVPYLERPGREGARDYVFSEWFGPNGPDEPVDFDRQVIADGQYKYFRKRIEGIETLHRMGTSPEDESPDLLSAAEKGDAPLTEKDQAALVRLRSELDSWVADPSGR